MEKIIVQKNTEDEFGIHYTLEGKIDSKNVLIMLHGGGMDHHEKGTFIGLKDGKPDKVIGEDGKLHTKIYRMPYGNYDRIKAELEADEVDTAIVRIDMRNHGNSLYNGAMDTRDTSIERMSRDLADIIDHLVDCGYENINLFGTCMGGLVSQNYVAGLGVSNKNIDKVKSLILDCSLSYANLYTTDKRDTFNYNKCQRILNGPGYQFNKMNGVYEGINTVNEAKKNGNIASLVGEKNIPTLYIYGNKDRLVFPETSAKIASIMKEVNPNVIIREVNNLDHGMADHCLYDPQSSDALVVTVITYYENVIEHLNKKELNHTK